MPLIDGFGLPARLTLWIRDQPGGVTLQVETEDILRDLRNMYPPRPDLGSPGELWDAIRQAEAEDAELGNQIAWRSFVLVAWAYDDRNPSGAPRTIRFVCPRSTWDVEP